MPDYSPIIPFAGHRPIWLVRLAAIFLLVLLGSAALPTTSHAHGIHALQPDLSQEVAREVEQAGLDQVITEEEAYCALGCCLIGSCLTVIDTAASHNAARRLHVAAHRPGLERWEIFDTGAGTRRPPKA